MIDERIFVNFKCDKVLRQRFKTLLTQNNALMNAIFVNFMNELVDNPDSVKNKKRLKGDPHRCRAGRCRGRPLDRRRSSPLLLSS